MNFISKNEAIGWLATGKSGNLELEKAWWRKAFEIFDIFCKKQQGYGPNNISQTGEKGVIIRMNDKMKRLLTLGLGEKESPLADESLRDTVIDIADYGIILLMCMDGDWPKYVVDGCEYCPKCGRFLLDEVKNNPSK